jgi:phosphoadenosine phosphosulfate reductase
MRCLNLLPSSRLKPQDILYWNSTIKPTIELKTRLNSQRINRLEQKALESISQFGDCYASISWGKDSTVLAYLSYQLKIPLVYIRVNPVANPECDTVRDAFLSQYPATYHEIEVDRETHKKTEHGVEVLKAGFAIAESRLPTKRYLTGIRKDEGSNRRVRKGVLTKNTCAPLAYWTLSDIWNYLCFYSLPVNPVYAMTEGGFWDYRFLRAGSLKGSVGKQFGKIEWERTYFC